MEVGASEYYSIFELIDCGELTEEKRRLIDIYVNLPEEVRGSGSVGELLGRIVVDEDVSMEEVLLFNDSFANPTPPEVDIEWNATRVVKDKIYDICVYFVAKDDKTPIRFAELRFVPVRYDYFITEYGMRPEDYDRVFPPEEPRVYVLKPVDGAFDELREEFKVDIKDIVGGKEYRIIVVVRDAAGNEREVEIKTPYIRQFPNIGRFLYEGGRLTPEELRTIGKTPGYEEFLKLAEEGKPLEFEGGLIIAATYYPLYPDPHPWEDLEPMAVHPLMGKYDVRDLIVIAKHIDWATGHGINCFFFSVGNLYKKEGMLAYNNLLIFLKIKDSNNQLRDLRIAIFYEVTTNLLEGGVNPDKDGLFHVTHVPWFIKKDFERFSREIFIRDDYIKIDDKPVIHFYQGSELRGDVDTFLKELITITPLYIISSDQLDFTTSEPSEEFIALSSKFDVWSMWAGGYNNKGEYKLDGQNVDYLTFYKEGLQNWIRIAHNYNREIVPSLIPGFIDLRDEDYDQPRSVETWEKILKYVVSYVNEGKIKFVRIDTYNEFGEATGIEPTKEECFSYLTTLRKTLLGILLNKG